MLARVDRLDIRSNCRRDEMRRREQQIANCKEGFQLVKERKKEIQKFKAKVGPNTAMKWASTALAITAKNQATAKGNAKQSGLATGQ